MSSILALNKQELSVLKLKKKIKSLGDGVEYLKQNIGFLHNVLLYKNRHGLPAQKQYTEAENTGSRTKVFTFKTDFSLKQEKKQDEFAVERFEKLFKQIGNTDGWNQNDFTSTSIEANPGYAIKKGGHYNQHGHYTYKAIYLPLPGGYHEVIPKEDREGLYFEWEGHKNYFVDYMPPPAAKRKRPDQVPVVEVGTSKKLLSRTGHGVARLLAEAKDPPVIEFRGALESLKGFTRRCISQHPEIWETTTTYKWGSPNARDSLSSVMFSFRSVEDRTHFLAKTTQSLPDYRLGNLAGWSKMTQVEEKRTG